MELANYAAASLIVAAGIFCGAALGYIAKEELKPGKKYLAVFQHIILAAIATMLVYSNSCPYLAVLFAFLFLARLRHVRFTEKPRQGFYYFAYAAFALLFFGTSTSSFFIAHASLIFLFGLPTGSLIFMQKGWLKRSLPLAAVFLVLSLLLFILSGTFLQL